MGDVLSLGSKAFSDGLGTSGESGIVSNVEAG